MYVIVLICIICTYMHCYVFVCVFVYVRAQLVYGTDTSPMRADIISKLEAFQLRGFRHFFYTTYVDRERSHNYVFQNANEAVHTTGNEHLSNNDR